MDKLEIGSGRTPTPGYDHFEINPDFPCVEFTSYKDIPSNRYKEIYARHVLEHMTQKEGYNAVRQWYRILVPGGKLHIIVPNLNFHLGQLEMGGESEFLPGYSNYTHAMAGIYGWQKSPYDIHKWGYTCDTLHSLLIGNNNLFEMIVFELNKECDIEAWASK